MILLRPICWTRGHRFTKKYPPDWMFGGDPCSRCGQPHNQAHAEEIAIFMDMELEKGLRIKIARAMKRPPHAP